MNSLTVLNLEQILGNDNLEIFKKYGARCQLTDFAILLGCSAFSKCYVNKDNTKKYYLGMWWTKSPYIGTSSVHTINSNGNVDWSHTNRRGIGVRPAIPYSVISKYCSNEVKISDGILTVQFGEYPSSIVESSISAELEKAFRNESLLETNKTYTTDALDHYQTAEFKPRINTEYYYNGKKYIRFYNDTNCDQKKLCNGKIIKFEKAYWIEVKPIIWLVDQNADIALAGKILFALPFESSKNYNGDFKNTDIGRYFDNYFLKEIIPSKIENSVEINKVKKLSKF